MFVLRASYKKNNYSRCGGPYNFVDLLIFTKVLTHDIIKE
jgi:hypothetical protein